MQTAKLFMNGNSQAVRLPKEFRFDGDFVYIRRQGNSVILSTQPLTWDEFFEQPSTFGDDFLAERQDDSPQQRESF
ncbi:MAG: type II toxin-antitoxin system VapB family antitoxin [Cyanobacteria bacterium J06648_16]